MDQGQESGEPCDAPASRGVITVPGPGTFGYLVGKLDTLRIECDLCDRHGRYSVDKLVAQYGPDGRLTDWLSERTRDCPQKSLQGVVRTCRAVMPDLYSLR